MKTVVVIPVYNEGKRVLEVLKSLRDKCKLKVVLVDDGSSERSINVLKSWIRNKKDIVLLRHKKNKGKGASMLTGALYCWENSFDSIIFMDGDGQHNPNEIESFINGLKKFPLVFGFRDMGKNMPIVRRWGNKVAKRLIKVLFGIDRFDLLCGYFAISKKVFNKIRWHSERYGVETEVATFVAKNKLKYLEVPVETIYKNKYKGVTLIDAVKILLKIPGWYFSK